MLYLMTCVYIWASLSDSHASMTTLCMCMLACLFACLLVCLDQSLTFLTSVMVIIAGASLVPRPTRKIGEKGLVSTVCACA